METYQNRCIWIICRKSSKFSLNLLKEREDYIESFEPEVSLSISGIFAKLGKSEYVITDENEEEFSNDYIKKLI